MSMCIFSFPGKTKINFAPENFEVAAGKSATFRCDAEADPSLQLNTVWLFNGKSVDVDTNTRMVQASDGSLTITKTVEGDSGTYTCVAKTELDQDEASATLTVQGKKNVFFLCYSLHVFNELKQYFFCLKQNFIFFPAVSCLL